MQILARDFIKKFLYLYESVYCFSIFSTETVTFFSPIQLGTLYVRSGATACHTILCMTCKDKQQFLKNKENF